MKNMKGSFKKLFDDILDKKFNINKVAGYDPLEVDMFLDNVRKYIYNMYGFVNDLEAEIRSNKNEISKLKNELSMNEETIKKLKHTIDSYVKDGYHNQRMAKEVGQLIAAVSELKDEKNK